MFKVLLEEENLACPQLGKTGYL